MKGITFEDNFIPQGECEEQPNPVNVAHVSAGVSWHELYAASDSKV